MYLKIRSSGKLLDRISLASLLNDVPKVPACLRTLCALRLQRAKILTCSTCLLCPTCQTFGVPYVTYAPKTFGMLYVLYVPYVPKILACSTFPTCLKFWRLLRAKNLLV